MPEKYNEKKLVIKWLFEDRCALCGFREPLEVHHAVYRRQRGDEQPGDIIPLCWGCHAQVEWLRSGASARFKAHVRKTMSQAKRLRVSLGQVGEWAEKYIGPLLQKLAEVEYELGFLQAMEDCWNEERGIREVRGRDAIQAQDNGEERKAA